MFGISSKILLTVVALATMAFASPAQAEIVGGGQKFQKVIHLVSTNLSPSPSANNDGRDYTSAKPMSDGDLLNIPANVILTNVWVVVDQAGSSLTAFNIGDDDDSDGFIASSSPNNAVSGLEVTGLKYWDIAYKGVYLKDSTVVANHTAAKLYTATGKELKLDVTGTSTNYKMRVFVEGYGIPKSGL